MQGDKIDEAEKGSLVKLAKNGCLDCECGRVLSRMVEQGAH